MQSTTNSEAIIAGHALREKFLQRQKAPVHCSAARKENAILAGDKQLMNRLSTASFFPPSVYIGIRLFLLLESRSGDVSSMLWRYEKEFSPRWSILLANIIESQTRIYFVRVESARSAERLGGVEQNSVPIDLFGQ